MLKPFSAREWGWLMAIFLLAIVWRLPYAISRPLTTEDEILFSLPTVERMQAGEWLFYVAGTNYAAPLQEALSVPLFARWGESLWALRLPVVLIGSLSVALATAVLWRLATPGVAGAIGLLLACANSTVSHYSTFAHPGYATLLGLLAGLQLVTFWVVERRTLLRWLCFAGLAGLALYQQKLAIMQVAVSLGWLAVRSGYGRQVWTALAAPASKIRLRCAGWSFGCAAFLVLPVLYRFLTRRESYHLSPTEAALLLGGLAAAIVAKVSLVSIWPWPNRSEWRLVVAVPLLLGPAVAAQIWFNRVELPRMRAAGIEPYHEVAYSWKHLHEWPKQGRILLQGVWPALVEGRWLAREKHPDAEWAWGVKGWLYGAATAGLLALALGSRPRWWEACLSRDVVIIAPFFLTLAVMLPSWLLFSDFAYRYLLPYLPGFYLALFRSAEQPLRRHAWWTGAALAAYVVYCGYDCATSGETRPYYETGRAAAHVP